MTTDRTKQKRWTWKLLLTLFLFALCVCSIDKLSLPVILMDEFGYWSNAAYFAGLDWSGVAQYNYYYSYGYSFFQSVLMRFISDPAVLYRGMIIVNAFFICGAFWLADAIMVRLLGEKSWLALGIAFFTACYPTNLSNAHIAWPESLLVVLCWLSMFILLQYLEKGNAGWIALWVTIILYAYVVHQRCLALLLAGGIVCFVGGITKKIPVRHIVLFVALAGILFFGATELKQIVKENVILSGINSDANINDYGSIFTYVLDNLNFDGFVKLLVSISGKVFCLMITSYLTWGVGVLYAVGKSVQLVVAGDRGKTKQANTLLAVYIVAFSVMSILIAAIFTLDPAQIDVLVYGRYTEWCIGPVVAFGVAALFKSKKPVRYLVPQGVVLIALTVVVSLVYASQGKVMSTFRWVCSAVLAFFYEIVPNTVAYVWVACGSVLAIAVVSGVLLSLNKGSRGKKEIALISIWCICSVAFGFYAIGRVMGSNYRREGLLRQQELIEAIDPDAEIRFLAEENSDQSLWYAASLQYLFRNKAIEKLDLDKQEGMQNYFFLCDAKEENLDQIQGIKLPIYRDSITVLYYAVAEEGTLSTAEHMVAAANPGASVLSKMSLSNGGTLQRQAKDGQWETIYIEDGEKQQQKDKKKTALDSQTVYGLVTSDDWTNDSIDTAVQQEAGKYVIYGPGISLTPGSYQVTFTLECLSTGDSTKQELGQCEVVSDNGENFLAVVPLEGRQFASNSMQTVTLEFSSSAFASLTGVEFRLFVEPGVQFRVTDISYQCVSLERQAMLPESEDYQLLRGVLDRDTDVLPVRIIAEDGLEPLLSCSQLQEALADTGREVSIVKRSELGRDPAVLLVPAEDTDLLFDLLPDFTVLVRMEEYALLVPSGYSVETAFRDVGGRPMSEGNALNLRYFLGAGEASYGNLAVNIPAGDYELRYRLSLNGTPLWSELGTLTLSGGNLSEQESLTAELFDDGYGTYENSRMLSLEESGQLRVGVSVHSGVSVVGLEAYLIRQ